MNWTEAAGYLASAMVFSTFCMKTIVSLRCVAIGSNVAFIAYGLLGHLHPVLALHVLLLPLNVFRLRQVLRPTAPSGRRGGCRPPSSGLAGRAVIWSRAIGRGP